MPSKEHITGIPIYDPLVLPNLVLIAVSSPTTQDYIEVLTTNPLVL
jgi:hypothetical protein